MPTPTTTTTTTAPTNDNDHDRFTYDYQNNHEPERVGDHEPDRVVDHAPLQQDIRPLLQPEQDTRPAPGHWAADDRVTDRVTDREPERDTDHQSVTPRFQRRSRINTPLGCTCPRPFV